MLLVAFLHFVMLFNFLVFVSVFMHLTVASFNRQCVWTAFGRSLARILAGTLFWSLSYFSVWEVTGSIFCRYTNCPEFFYVPQFGWWPFRMLTGTLTVLTLFIALSLLTFWRRNYFFNFSTPVYKMWIIQQPNTLELWNRLHFEEKEKRKVYIMLKIFSTYICWINI